MFTWLGQLSNSNSFGYKVDIWRIVWSVLVYKLDRKCDNNWLSLVDYDIQNNRYHKHKKNNQLQNNSILSSSFAVQNHQTKRWVPQHPHCMTWVDNQHRTSAKSLDAESIVTTTKILVDRYFHANLRFFW